MAAAAVGSPFSHQAPATGSDAPLALGGKLTPPLAQHSLPTASTPASLARAVLPQAPPPPLLPPHPHSHPFLPHRPCSHRLPHHGASLPHLRSPAHVTFSRKVAQHLANSEPEGPASLHLPRGARPYSCVTWHHLSACQAGSGVFWSCAVASTLGHQVALTHHVWQSPSHRDRRRPPQHSQLASAPLRPPDQPRKFWFWEVW